jgi:hypothetical protein
VGSLTQKLIFRPGCRRDAGTRTSSFPTEGKTLPSRLRTVVWPRSFLPGSARRSMSTHPVDPAPRSALRRTRPSGHQTEQKRTARMIRQLETSAIGSNHPILNPAEHKRSDFRLCGCSTNQSPCPPHLNTPKYALHGPTVSRYGCAKILDIWCKCVKS